MTESFSFEDLEFLTVGTLGPRGERIFYLQGRGDGHLVSLKLEKQQVKALADYLDRILTELPDIGEPESDADLTLREPVVAAWTIGTLGLAYSADRGRLILHAERLIDDDDDDTEPTHATFSLRRDQVVGLIVRARHVVAAGRAPCLFCGGPLDPRDGEWCRCSN